MCAEAARGWAAAVIRKVAPHVPVSAPVVRAPAPVLAGLVQVNICAAQLLTTFLPAAQVTPAVVIITLNLNSVHPPLAA
jgi:hypothetical protein